jgi:NAD(P)-dependent dehydrogenase (short-subunit alcohol dehydrogenase family)
VQPSRAPLPLPDAVGLYGITCNTQLRAYSLPRLGRADDVAAAIAWLTSDDGFWVTGQTIPVNGGYASS